MTRTRSNNRPAHQWFVADSPAGPVCVAHHNGKVTGLLICGADPDDTGADESCDPGEFEDYMRREVGVALEHHNNPDPRWVTEVESALAEGRTDVPVDLSCRSEFHRKVLEAAAQIPKGEVATYSDLAAVVGHPRAARAVGQAMARNPVPLLVPCHRVVPAGGGVGNYGPGPALKQKLLNREGALPAGTPAG